MNRRRVVDVEKVARALRKGGNLKKTMDEDISRWVHSLDLSDDAIRVVCGTSLEVMTEMFGYCGTAEEVEEAAYQVLSGDF